MSFPVDVENDGLASNAAYDLYAGGRSSSPSSSSSTRGLVDRVNSDIDVLITRNGSSSSSSTSTNTVLLATKEPSRQTTRFLGIDHPPNAIFSVVILFVVNLLNYIDRYIPSATKTSIQSDFDLNDAETAFPLTAFMIVYMLASPIFAHLSDLGWSRPRLMSSGVILWSILTALCALCPNYASFLTVRALTGIGESSYSVIAPSIISDFYASHDRSRVMALFYLGIPVGSAIGFGLGAGLSQLFGWRVAFAAVGLPGVILGVLMLRMVDPERGGLDDPEERRVRVAQRHQHPLRVVLSVLTNRYFLGVSVGLTLQTFGIGGMADWFPTYLQHVQHMSEAYAGTVVGGVVVVGGIIGTIGGGWLADHTASHVRNSYLAMCGWSTLLAAGVAALIIAVASSDAVVIVLLLVTQALIWMSVGPSNAIVANVVTASQRARAFSVLIMMQHALGDAISPSIIGAVSDASSLHAAAYIVPISWIAASAAWLFASRTLPPHQHGELAAELLRQEALMEGAVVVVDEEVGATSQGKRKRSTPGADDDGDAAAAPRMSVASPMLVL